MDETVRIDAGKDAIKGDISRLVGGVIAGIIVGILFFFGIIILAHNILGINNARELGTGFIIFFLALIAISGYVSHSLVDGPNKIKLKGLFAGIISGIISGFVVAYLGSALRVAMGVPYTSNYLNTQNIFFTGFAVGAIISGYVSYHLTKNKIVAIVAAIAVPPLSFLISMFMFL